MPFDGLRVVSFESRRATEMGELIRRQGGDPFVAPSMRESPIENNPEAFEFAERLFRGDFDLMIFLTGVGTRALNKVLASRYPEEQFAEALRKITVAARGPKPLAALRELKVPVAVTAPEPNTWRELLAALDGRPERHIAVQEYGKSNHELLEALRARGAEVTPVRVYQWDLPEDVGAAAGGSPSHCGGSSRRRDVHHLHPDSRICSASPPKSELTEPMQQCLAPHGHRLHRPHHYRDAGRIRPCGRHHAQPSEDGLPGERNRRAGRGNSASASGRRMPKHKTVFRSNSESTTG